MMGSFTSKLALSPDAKVLAVGSADRAIEVREVASGKDLHHFPGHRTFLIGAAFGADARSLYTTSQDGGYCSVPQPGVEWSLRQWDVTTGQELKCWVRQPRTETRQAVFSADGALLAVTENSGKLRLFHTRTGTELRAWQLPLLQAMVGGKPYATFWPGGLAFSPDGKEIAFSTAGKIHFWDWATRKKLREFDLPGRLATNFCFAPDARSLLVVDWDSLHEVDATTGARLRQFAASCVGAKVRVSPNGYSVVVLGHFLQTFGTVSGQERWSSDLAAWGPFAFSPDGRALAVAGTQNEVCTFDLLTGKLLHRMRGHASRIDSLAYSPDSRRLVSTAGNVALVWDVEAVRADPAPAPLTRAELQACWRDLGDQRAVHAAQALTRLVRSAESATPFLCGELAKLKLVSPKQVERWIAELDDDDFDVRERATRSLHDCGARLTLEKALNAPPSLEAKRRIERLLEDIKGLPANWLRMRRGVEALELIGDARACEAFRHLAKQGLDPELRQLAAQSVLRLQRRR